MGEDTKQRETSTILEQLQNEIATHGHVREDFVVVEAPLDLGWDAESIRMGPDEDMQWSLWRSKLCTRAIDALLREEPGTQRWSQQVARLSYVLRQYGVLRMRDEIEEHIELAMELEDDSLFRMTDFAIEQIFEGRSLPLLQYSLVVLRALGVDMDAKKRQVLARMIEVYMQYPDLARLSYEWVSDWPELQREIDGILNRVNDDVYSLLLPHLERLSAAQRDTLLRERVHRSQALVEMAIEIWDLFELNELVEEGPDPRQLDGLCVIIHEIIDGIMSGRYDENDHYSDENEMVEAMDQVLATLVTHIARNEEAFTRYDLLLELSYLCFAFLGAEDEREAELIEVYNDEIEDILKALLYLFGDISIERDYPENRHKLSIMRRLLPRDMFDDEAKRIIEELRSAPILRMLQGERSRADRRRLKRAMCATSRWRRNSVCRSARRSSRSGATIFCAAPSSSRCRWPSVARRIRWPCSPLCSIWKPLTGAKTSRAMRALSGARSSCGWRRLSVPGRCPAITSCR